MTAEPVDHRVLDRGTRSGLDAENPTLLAAAEPAVWERLWSDHGREPPEVDWAREWAGLVVVGTRRTGGYAVHVEEVVAGPEGPVVRYREEEPGEEDVVIQSLTDPWVAFAVDREAAPPEGADLERVGSDD